MHQFWTRNNEFHLQILKVVTPSDESAARSIHTDDEIVSHLIWLFFLESRRDYLKISMVIDCTKQVRYAPSRPNHALGASHIEAEWRA